MPSPTKGQLKPIIDGLFMAKNFTGENVSDFSDVLAEAIAQSLNMFMLQVKVAPGIPAPPPAGPTAAPGFLM